MLLVPSDEDYTGVAIVAPQLSLRGTGPAFHWHIRTVSSATFFEPGGGLMPSILSGRRTRCPACGDGAGLSDWPLLA